ncbi:MAG: hypothetical protein JJU22_17990 [Gammaproteobacteria bacterium]|nr:hypothetical protein [Gammaproteobacteria bacterium]
MTVNGGLMTLSNDDGAGLTRTRKRFEQAWLGFAKTPAFARHSELPPLLDASMALLQEPGGAALLYPHAIEFDALGLFAGSDWAEPATLRPELVSGAFTDKARVITVELLSELRILAIAEGRLAHPELDPEQARGFLETVLALNLARLFPRHDEADRVRHGKSTRAITHTLQFIVERIGYASVFNAVVQEAESMLAQRPILVQPICRMIAELGRGEQVSGATPLFDALYCPTAATADDPGVSSYQVHLSAMTGEELEAEAHALAGHLSTTGLASAYHAALVRHLRGVAPALLPTALALSSTGSDALLNYQELVLRLIDEAVFPETAQAIYGLHALLESGALYFPPVPHGLWRQIVHPIREDVQTTLREVFGDDQPPRVWLLSGLIQVLGQPLGIGQGDNPTCQSARALSLWAQCDPGYLLQLLLWATRDGEIVMSFEGEAISSKDLAAGLAEDLHTELDPISLILVPHLDRIYGEMWRRVEDRKEDGHRWINPEFHGWWVQRGFAICVDIFSGAIIDFEAFIRRFHAHYHPYYNGNQPVIFPQPAGIASTTSGGEFVGWHAIAIQRVGLGPTGDMRVYFNNPNNEGRQDWGSGVVTSVTGHGEIPGESSLTFEQFCSRLYLFHYDPLEQGEPDAVDAQVIADIAEAASSTWAAGRAFETG